MDSNPVNASAPLTQQRRTKQHVPDTQKDNSYWQKRYRNNIAAKKSRENKRLYECMVRSKVIALEEENCLLKKELELLKERFNIPKDAGVLSPAERDECLQEFRNRNSSMHNSVKRHEGSGSSFDSSDYSSSNSPCGVHYENSRNEMKTERATTPVSSHVWAITPAHSKSLQHYAESSEIYRNEISEGNDQDYNTGYKRKWNMSNEACMNEEEIASKNPCRVKRARDFTTRSTDFCKTANDSSTKSDQSGSNFQDDNNTPVDLSRDTSESDNINSDIKNKLQLLSDQVERMQKLVCNV